MTAFSTTITNTVKVFSPEPSEKWNTLVWGSDYWGYGTSDLPIVFTKGIGNSVSLSDDNAKTLYKNVLNSIANTSTIGRNFSKGIAESVANTTAVGKNIMHYYTNAVANTTTVGKNMLHAIYENVDIFTLVDRGVFYWRLFSESTALLTGQQVYQIRDGYYQVQGGISNAVSWPSGGIYTAATSTTLTWTVASTSSTVWT